MEIIVKNGSNDNNTFEDDYPDADAAIDKIVKLIGQTIGGVEEKIWSKEDGCYIDIQETHHIGGPYRTLTQDVSLYLVALTENTNRDSLLGISKVEDEKYKIRSANNNGNNSYLHDIGLLSNNQYDRAISTLNAIRERVWKEKWPLVTEVELKSTGPWILKPYQYHNHTFWPWTTGIEMLARSRLDKLNECKILLSTLASESHPHIHTFYEWLNPITDSGDGAYPFRTGIAGVRIALREILMK